MPNSEASSRIRAAALIPGLTITVTNTETSVVSRTVTNESGAYNFPSLQPGLQSQRLSSWISDQNCE